MKEKIAKADLLLAGALPLLGIFIIYAPWIMAHQSLYLGIVQEQYYLLGQFSFDHLIRQEFAQGLFPLWNPNNALGTPLLANMLSAVFYPLKIFLYLSPAHLTYELYLLFRFWLGGFFAYLLARKLLLKKPTSAVVVFAFTFSGYFQLFLNENYLNADFLLPLLVLLAIKLRESAQRKWVFLFSLGLFALFNSGHPEAIFYNWLFLGITYLGLVSADKKPARLQAGGRFLLANLFAGVLSLPLFLPFLEFWFRGWHFHLPGTGLYHYSVREFLALFSPWFFGASQPGSAFFHPPEISSGFGGRFPGYQESTLPWLVPSLGMIFLPVLVLGFLEIKKLRRIYQLWLVWCLTFLGLSFGLFGFQFLGLVFPFSLSGNFKHPFPAIILSLSIIGALILERLLHGKISRKNYLLALGISGVVFLSFFPYQGLERAKNFPLAVELGLVGIFLLWVLFACGKKHIPSLGMILGAGLMLVSAQLRLNWQEPVYIDYHLSQLRSHPVFQKLKKDSRLFRFYFTREIFPPNLNQLLEVPDLRVMDGINHYRLVNLVNFINGHSREEGFRYWYHKVGYLEVMPEKLPHPLLDLLGLKYIITRSPLPYNRSPEKILEQGTILAPAPEYVGLAYFPRDKAEVKTLFQHPPSRVSFNLNALSPIPEKSRESNLKAKEFWLSFSPQIQPGAWEKEKDGVWFMIINHSALLYCRFLYPRKHPGERNSKPMAIKLKLFTEPLDLLTLPHNYPEYDWAGWRDLRLEDKASEPEGRNFKLLAGEQFWLYENPRAFPKIFLASPEQIFPEKSSLTKINRWLSDLRDKNLRARLEQEGELDFTGKNFQLISANSQKYQITLRTSGPYWLIFGELNYPGWRAYLDGKEKKLERVYYLFSGLYLPGGIHQVKLTYQPWSFGIGIYFALAGIFVLLFFVFLRQKFE